MTRPTNAPEPSAERAEHTDAPSAPSQRAADRAPSDGDAPDRPTRSADTSSLRRRVRSAATAAALLAVGVAIGTCFSGSGPSDQPAAHDHSHHSEASAYTCSMHPQVRSPDPGACPICGMELIPITDSADSANTGDAADTEYTCSMHPQVRSPDPGDCPICGMALIPVTKDADHSADQATRRVTLSPAARALARVRTTEVKRYARPAPTLRLLGRVDTDETRVRTVTAWTDGRIERLRVAATGARIKRGQVIADIYSPTLYNAHQDLILANRQVTAMSRADPASLARARAAVTAARQRLALLGVPEATIDTMQKATEPSRRMPIRSPFAGTVIERLVDAGSYVNAGTGLFRVADLSQVWVQLDAYESDLPRLAVGQPVELTAEAIPGQTLTGQVAFIDPVIDARARTARVRVAVKNPQRQLRPGMFAAAVVGPAAAEQTPSDSDGDASLLIPASAPLYTGHRSLVYVARGDTERPTYEAREVTLGPRLGDMYQVLSGLTAGEYVVTSGAFALDADLQIRAGESMMSASADAPAPTAALPVTPRLRAALAPTVRAYLKVQAALAQDDLDGARAAARTLPAAIATEAITEAITSAGAKPSLRAAWEPLALALAGQAGQVSVATDINAARRAFEPLSQSLIELLSRFGNPLDEPVHLAYCPMAFGDTGAYWVQQSNSVENSYQGANMFSCGVIETAVDADTHLPDEARPTPSEATP